MLRRATTIPQASNFLRDRELHHSAGTWDDLLDKRVRPALEAGALSIEDLARFLRNAEEYGRQHVFLYRCAPKRALELMDRQLVEKGLAVHGATSVLSRPILDETPQVTRIVDVRWEDRGKRFLLKVAEPRVYQTLVEEQQEGDYFVKRYANEVVRAINVFDLSANGLLQLRIQSHRAAKDYEEDVRKMWRLAEPVLPLKSFSQVSLSRAKERLWTEREQLAHKILHSDTRSRDNYGTILSASASRESVSISRNATGSLDGFLRRGGVLDAMNLLFLGEQEGGNERPPEAIRVMFPVGVNHFVVAAQCTREDYDRVLEEILGLN